MTLGIVHLLRHPKTPLAGMKNNDSMMQLHVNPLGHPNMMHDSKLFSIYFIIAETKAFSFSNIIDFIQW